MHALVWGNSPCTLPWRPIKSNWSQFCKSEIRSNWMSDCAFKIFVHRSAKPVVNHHIQGDQSGGNFFVGWLFTLDHCLKITDVAQSFRLLFQSFTKFCVYFDKNELGYILGYSFKNASVHTDHVLRLLCDARQLKLSAVSRPRVRNRRTRRRYSEYRGANGSMYVELKKLPEAGC
jgi:hypothetical protein